MSATFAPPAQGEVLLLDGGLATTLEARGYDLSGPLWSARLLQDDPGALREVHRAFLDAGAEVLLTASYQLSGPGLRWLGASSSLAATLATRSVALAREAVDASGATARVAASLGPYGALLADGSEYRGRYGLPRARLRDVHAPRLTALLDAGPDLLAVETVPSGAEVAVLVDLLDGAPLPAWVSVTVGADGTRTPEGEPLDEALGPALDRPEVVAVGVNCLPSELVAPALDRLAGSPRPLLVKPNLGARWDPGRRGWRARPAPDPAPWLEAGARLVGGCCGTTPADLRNLVDRVVSWRSASATGGAGAPHPVQDDPGQPQQQ
jgi:homocysteine S-methyltransferase